ncbi:hypothetical protein [[Phormidium ambiguum] IAM M-71]|uniref:hypothetical protein n=1 Tax=[Phormidium ambiguum] IAM M-71 TaxID=454136 RepID=UPI0015B7B725|nr:hypothetical protein [Phormidium ambiguum]
MPLNCRLDVLTIQLDKLTEAELLEVRSIVDALLEVKAFPEKSGSGHIEVKKWFEPF